MQELPPELPNDLRRILGNYEISKKFLKCLEQIVKYPADHAQVKVLRLCYKTAKNQL